MRTLSALLVIISRMKLTMIKISKAIIMIINLLFFRSNQIMIKILNTKVIMELIAFKIFIIAIIRTKINNKTEKIQKLVRKIKMKISKKQFRWKVLTF